MLDGCKDGCFWFAQAAVQICFALLIPAHTLLTLVTTSNTLNMFHQVCIAVVVSIVLQWQMLNANKSCFV